MSIPEHPTAVATSDDLTLALRAAVRGTVTGPADPGYDAARATWNLAVDQRPCAVAEVAHRADIAAVLAVARRHGRRVAAQSTGHGAGALGELAGTILLRTGALRDVAVDPEARTVRVGAGAQWAEVLAATAPYGLAPLAGSSGSVGVVGYVLGGGMSFLGRRFGLAANDLLSLDVVLPSGEPVRVSADEHPDLFWALRGGGTGIGVVAGLTLGLHPVAELVAGQLFFPLERATEVLRGWCDWTRTAPEELTTSARMMRFPPDPGLPEPLRGGAFVILDGAFTGGAVACAEALAPLAALGPLMDTWAPAGITALSLLHLDPPMPVPAFTTHTLLADLDDATLDALVAAAGAGSGTSTAIVELRQLGGAFARPVPGGGARSAVGAGFSFMAIAIPGGPFGPETLHADLGRAHAAVAPQAAGTLSTWMEQPGAPSSLTVADAERLDALRAALDPAGLLQAAGD